MPSKKADENRDKELSIEESFEVLDTIIEKLSDKDTPLEEAFKEYNRGIELVKKVNGSLDMVEKKLIQLQPEE